MEQEGPEIDAQVFPTWHALVERFTEPVIVSVDIPIGLPERGSRQCDLDARRFLGKPRNSSVFPAPVRGCVRPGSYAEINAAHYGIDGRGLTRQAYGLLEKIAQVDQDLRADPSRQQWIREIHPEVSFTCWNGGRPMRHNKKKPCGRTEREALIETVWPAQRARLAMHVRGHGCAPDDLNDAFAALWTARRIAARSARVFPEKTSEVDARGLRMEIFA